VEQSKNLFQYYAGLLALYAGVAGLILAIVFQVTEPLKITNARQIEINARKDVLLGAVTFEAVTANNLTYFVAYDKNHTKKGYVVKASGRGYSSSIETLIGLTTDFNIAGMKILTQAETPGLGAKITERSFTQQFINKKPTVLAVQKDGGEIIAITGATISSRAVAESVRQTIRQVSDSEGRTKKHA
jgi:electron transport complex protein RnfG